MRKLMSAVITLGVFTVSFFSSVFAQDNLGRTDPTDLGPRMEEGKQGYKVEDYNSRMGEGRVGLDGKGNDLRPKMDTGQINLDGKGNDLGPRMNEGQINLDGKGNDLGPEGG